MEPLSEEEMHLLEVVTVVMECHPAGEETVAVGLHPAVLVVEENEAFLAAVAVAMVPMAGS
jgi:hypothetical protein